MALIGEQAGYVRKPSEGPAFWFPGERLTMQATGEQTGGALAFLEDVAAPDGGPPLHLHPEADEAFYVLDGELEVTLGERSLSSPAGSFVWVPRGTPHTWLVRGDRPARFLALYTRAGCEPSRSERRWLRYPYHARTFATRPVPILTRWVGGVRRGSRAGSSPTQACSLAGRAAYQSVSPGKRVRQASVTASEHATWSPWP
jgi:quercetin dioxygenase-like cupin family protein